MKTALSICAVALLLAACSETTAPTRDYAGDAFDKLNTQIGYADARIEYDPRSGCANYVATDPQGRPYREPLRYDNGMTICRQ